MTIWHWTVTGASLKQKNQKCVIQLVRLNDFKKCLDCGNKAAS